MSLPIEEQAIVVQLSREMLRKLRLNAHKPHWKGIPAEDLLMDLLREVFDLASELEAAPRNHQAVMSEAADVANFAAMIAARVVEEQDAAEAGP